MAGEIKHVDQVVIADDPTVASAGGITPTRWNKALRLSGGTDGQIAVRSTAADATTGMDLTSTPSVNTIVFPLTAPSSPANGSFWVEDDGVTLTLYVKRADGSTASLEIG